MVLYLFELYDNFQGPPRTWLNLLCAWSGIPLLAVTLWRMAQIVAELCRRRAVALEEVYCASLILLSAAALIYMSLRFPFGWTVHPEYVLAAYPAAAVLVFRQLLATRRTWTAVSLYTITAVHLTANLAMIFHASYYKIALTL
jgi:hypothetical protein